MSKVIDNLNALDIPTDSVLRAVQVYNDRYRDQDSDKQLFVGLAGQILGKHFDLLDAPYARTQVGYIVQESVTRFLNGHGVDVEDVFEVATIKTHAFNEQYSWTYAKPEEEVKLDAQGKPKRKKGAKQEEAAQIYAELKGQDKKVIIERFMKDLDMSKAGATTYFYNMRKKFGE